MKIRKTTNGKEGGNIGGKKHTDGGVKAIIVDSGKPVEIESGEVIINAKSVKKHWKTLDKINRSEGGISIHAPVDEIAKTGGKIEDNSEKSRNFTSNTTKDEINHIISGTHKVSFGANIQAITSYLRASESADSLSIESFKEKEENNLKKYISENNLWFSKELGPILDSGHEHVVYLSEDGKHVIKTNNKHAFQKSWKDYLNNLLLNNHFFPQNAYQLLGFKEANGKLLSVVKQVFVQVTEKTDKNEIIKFLEKVDFLYNRNNNYRNYELGIDIEILHTNNVLTENGVLQFIDTVFKFREDKKLGGNITEDFDDSIFYKDVEEKKRGGNFDDYLEEFEQESENKIDNTPVIVTETIELGRELIQKDYLNEIKKIVKIKKFTSEIKELNLYKLGWRFQFGSSRQWAGLCSTQPKDQMKSKDKNIYVSIQFTKHDASWKTEMRDVIYHEIAHALVLEIFHFNKANERKLHAIDDSDKASKGHGSIWKAVSKAISGKELRIFYENANTKESFKPFMYECPNCEHVGYGDYFKFTDSCDNCNSSVLTQANII